MSMASAAQSRADGAIQDEQSTSPIQTTHSASDSKSVSSDKTTENLSFWQRLTRRVIRDLMGIDEDTLSVIFGEALPEEAISAPVEDPPTTSTAFLMDKVDVSSLRGEHWEHRLLERVARELGILVNQLSEHPGAFSTYCQTQETPEYAGLPTLRTSTTVVTDSLPSTSQPTVSSPTSAHFAPTFPAQLNSHLYSEASLWGIEEEPEVDPLHSFRSPPASLVNSAEETIREKEYWERELDVKMVFNFLLRRFSSRRSSIPSQRPRSSNAQEGQQWGSPSTVASNEAASARRAAIIRQHHPLVSRNTERIPTSSTNVRENRRKDTLYRQHLNHQTSIRSQALKSSSSCASQSTKKSKRSAGSGRNYWDLGGSVGSGSVLAGEV